jgi:hypothetical protein
MAEFDHEHEHDPGGGKAIAPVPAGGALASLAALTTLLNSVDTGMVIGRSGLPLMSFKREGNGTWMYGQKRTVVEEGSCWAVDPTSFKWGFVAFENKKVVGERLVPVSQPKPDLAELPNVGAKWTEQWAVDLKCINGIDAGTHVVWKPTTDGGIKAVAGLIEAVRDKINGGQHEGKVVPVARLEKDSYPHPEHGCIWVPVLTIANWMPLNGPAAAPNPASPSPPVVEQPRRRRVA